MTKNSIILLSLCALLTSCAALGGYRHETGVADNLYGDGVTVSGEASIAELGWREAFTDPILQEYIRTALDNNPDVKIAAEHISQAEAQLAGAKLGFLPGLSLAPSYAASFSGEGLKTQTGSWKGGLQSSWQLNIFRMLNDVKSARSALEQSEDYRRAVMVSLVQSVADNYYNLLMLDAQLATSQLMYDAWGKSLEAVGFMKEQGLADQVAVSQYQANYDDIQITVLGLQNSLNATENALCLLMGTEPRHGLDRGSLDAQNLPEMLSAGVPARMLALRPDVRAAEADMEQAHYARRGALLDFFPSVTINGELALASVSPLGMLAGVSAGLVAPVLNYGRNRTALKLAESRQRETRLAFDKTLLQAGKEVNDAMYEYRTRSAMEESLESRVAALRQASEDTEYLMRNSLDKTYLDVLYANTNCFSAELQQIENRAARLRAVVALYAALGGGTVE